MATMLATAFREQMKETKDFSKMNEMNYSVSYGTGFLPLDYATGYIQEIDGQYKYELGLSDGSINTLIGNTGTGKTSLLVAMSCNIIKRFKHGAIFFEQAEVGTNIQRIKNLSGIRDNTDFTDRFIVRDAGITIESIYKRVCAIHDIKLANTSTYMYDTGIIDMMGNRVMKFEPTIFIVDSIKLVLSEKNAAAEEMNNMSGANNAKVNSEYYTKMVPLCREANIIMILVNHIAPRVSTDIVPQKSEFPYLSQNEHLSNAKLLQYISNLIMRLDIKAKLDPNSDKNNLFGISGTLVSVDIVKSRTNKSGRARCVLVFDQEIGFDPDLSMFMMLKMNDVLEGSGRYKIPGCDIKFTAKNFKELLYTNPEFYTAFNQFCFTYISDLLFDEYKRVKHESDILTSGRSAYDAIIEQFSGFAKNIEDDTKQIPSLVEEIETK